ncbi:MAG TPA: glycosyltransferase family 4 protein [Solirubrobacterales bacterium]
MKVQIVDPPAYTPPYDRSLCAALARSGADVELVTSRFSHGTVPPAEGYRVSELFYRRSGGRPGGGFPRRALKAAEHLGDMVRYRRNGGAADVVHYQWLPLPAVDGRLLPPTRPRVLTAHGVLREEGFSRRLARGLQGLLERMDAIVTLSEHGARRLRDEARVEGSRVRVIPHGALDYLTRLPDEAPLPEELAGVEGPVILCFGLIRPYKGVDVLLDAFRSIDGAELWVVGRPLGISMDELWGAASRAASRVRFVPRFVPDRELPAYFRRADLVVLPHRDAEQSGVLFAALAFGNAIVMSDVGGFAEVAAHGAGQLVPPGDPAALADAIEGLLDDPGARDRLAASARKAAAGPYSWDAVAAQTMALYGELRG